MFKKLSGAQENTKMVTGLEFLWASAGIVANMLWLAIKRFRDPLKAIKVVRQLMDTRNDFKTKHNRMVKCNGRYYMNLHTPGWPSLAFDRGIDHAFNVYSGNTTASLFSFIFSITNKCGFHCEHCVEWDQLNAGDSLDVDTLIRIVHRFHELGVCQVHLSGGEPLNRINDILSILESVPSGIDFWVFTNGYNLDYHKAFVLRKHGLTGVVISLDHYDPDKHDTFRGVPGSFQRALNAARAARAHGLLVAFSCCATNEFIRTGYLDRYVSVCKKAGASFIQLLEPEAVGHYAGQKVQLTNESRHKLEGLFYEVNFDPSFNAFPIVSYPAMVKRDIGCQGKGLHYLYVSSEGFVQSCPFCRKKMFHFSDPDLKDRIISLRTASCSVFNDPPHNVESTEYGKIIPFSQGRSLNRNITIK